MKMLRTPLAVYSVIFSAITLCAAQVDGAASTPSTATPVVSIKPDTSQNRLEDLQIALQTTLDNLKAASPDAPDSFVEKTMIEVQSAQADVVQSLAYVKAHPEADVLSVDVLPTAVPFISQPAGMGLLTQARVTTFTEIMMPVVVTTLQAGLVAFINGPITVRRAPAAIRAAEALLWALWVEIGDKIIRSVGLAVNDLARSLTNVAQNKIVPAEVALPNSSTPKPGSISGIVVDTDGDPAANVLIGLTSKSDPLTRAIASMTLPPAGTAPYRGFQASVANMTLAQRQASAESQS